MRPETHIPGTGAYYIRFQNVMVVFLNEKNRHLTAGQEGPTSVRRQSGLATQRFESLAVFCPDGTWRRWRDTIQERGHMSSEGGLLLIMAFPTEVCVENRAEIQRYTLLHHRALEPA